MKKIFVSVFMMALVLFPGVSARAQTSISSSLTDLDFSGIKRSGIQATGGNSWGGYGVSSSFPFYVRYSTEGLSAKGCTASDSTQSYKAPLKQIIAYPNIFTSRELNAVGTTGTLGNLLQPIPANGGYNIISCSDVTSPNMFRAIKWSDGLIGMPNQRSFSEEYFRYDAKKNSAGEVVINWTKTLNLKCDSIIGYDTTGKQVGNTHGFNSEQINTSGSLVVGYLDTETVFSTTCFNEENISAGQRTNLRAFITVPASPDPNPVVVNTTPVVVPRTFKLPSNNACRTITFTQDLKQGDTSNEVLALEKMIKGGFYVFKGMPLSFETPNTYFDSKTSTFVSILQTLGGNFPGDGKVTALERAEFNKLPLCASGAIGISPQTTTIYDSVAKAPTTPTTSTVTAPTTSTQQSSTNTTRDSLTGNSSSGGSTSVTSTTINNITNSTKPVDTTTQTTAKPATSANTQLPVQSAQTAPVSGEVCRTTTFRSTMLAGSRGGEVAALQLLLTKLGYMNQNTGFFGKATKSAVVRFQENKGIYPTNGRVSTLTVASLNSYPLCN